MLDVASFSLTPNVTMTVTRPKMYDVKYTQVRIFAHNLGPGGSFLDVPIGPPLARIGQIFQIRMDSSSSLMEYAVHQKKYDDCTNPFDYVFYERVKDYSTILQEVWLDFNCSRIQPYLYASFRELAGEDPVKACLEFRLTAF